MHWGIIVTLTPLVRMLPMFFTALYNYLSNHSTTNLDTSHVKRNYWCARQQNILVYTLNIVISLRIRALCFLYVIAQS